jgi:hypothetical protein
VRKWAGGPAALAVAIALCLVVVAAPSASAHRGSEPAPIEGHVPSPQVLSIASAKRASWAKVRDFRERSPLVDRVTYNECVRDSLRSVTCTFTGHGGPKATGSTCTLTVLVTGLSRSLGATLTASCRANSRHVLTFQRASAAIRTAAEAFSHQPAVIAIARRRSGTKIEATAEWTAPAARKECEAPFVATLTPSGHVAVAHTAPTCFPAFIPSPGQD